MEKSGGEFLNIKYPDLQKSDQVQKSVDKKVRIEGVKTPNNPKDRNEVFLDRLENIFNNPNKDTKERNVELFKNRFLYPNVLIDKNDVPENYFELQKKIAREQGRGDIEITQQLRQMAGETLYNDQKKSLDSWTDYLTGNDSIYPTWFKYYTLKNVVKMGAYDKEKKEFGKRSKTTTGIFPDLNREALSFTYDVLEKHYLKHEKHDNAELNRIVNSANFSKIYAYAIDKVTPASKENKEKTEGEWIKFTQGDDHIPLYESLQGHGTGWCTAGEETAKTQLKNGDFYVYYSKDQDNKNTIPRIAIRMENDQVAEVRGIEKDQNLEGNMTNIAQEKYHQLPGGEKFEKKDHDMKLVTQIDSKIKDGQELTEDEILFIYEIRDEIEGFGYNTDPRIEEILSSLNMVECFNKLSQKEDKVNAASYLAIEVTKNVFSGENLDKAWSFINNEGDSETALILVREITRYSGEKLNKIVDFAIKSESEKTAPHLIHGIITGKLLGENLDKAWSFIKSVYKVEDPFVFLSDKIFDYDLNYENMCRVTDNSPSLTNSEFEQLRINSGKRAKEIIDLTNNK